MPGWSGVVTVTTAAPVGVPSNFPCRPAASSHRCGGGFQWNPLCIPPDIVVSAVFRRARVRDVARMIRRPFAGFFPSDGAVFFRYACRFSIKRHFYALQAAPHPENPAYDKWPSGHKICPKSHSILLKYTLNAGLSSQKTAKMRFFPHFDGEKPAFSCLIPAAARALPGSGTARTIRCRRC